MKKTVYRSKITGQFVTEETARATPKGHAFDEVTPRNNAWALDVPGQEFTGMTVSELVANFDLTGYKTIRYQDVLGYDIILVPHAYGEEAMDAISDVVGE